MSASSVDRPVTDLQIGLELGRGACSAVHACVSKESSVLYAAKIIEKDDIRGEKHLERLYRERDILRACQLPNVIRLHGTMQDEKRLFLLLELVLGGDLHWHMHQAPGRQLGIEAARVCGAQVAMVMADLWRQGVLYRDIKPPNIMFDEFGRVKLVDFGHAKRMPNGERSDSVVGTPHYMSPEAAKGMPHGVNAQIWALGILIAELILGHPPFIGTTDEELRHRITSEELPEDMLRQCGAPEACLDLLRKLLRKEERDREAEFPNAFESVLNHDWLVALNGDDVRSGRLMPRSVRYSEHASELSAALARESEATGGPGAEDDPFADF